MRFEAGIGFGESLLLPMSSRTSLYNSLPHDWSKIWNLRWSKRSKDLRNKGEINEDKPMNNSFELFRLLNKKFYISQMNYSWACLRLSLLCFGGLLISYFIEGFISWTNHVAGNCTKMFLTTLGATMIPQTLSQPQTSY